MRLIAPGGRTPPREVNKYLLLHEHQVITVRMHPAVLLGPVVIALGGLVAAVVLQGSVLREQAGLMAIIWILWGILFLRALWYAATWSVDYFVVTSQRMILTSGLLTRKVAMMPLNKVTDMSFQRSFGGRLFGYGEFIIESAGQDQALRNIPFIPYPEQLYLEVCNLLFPGASADDSGSQCRYPGPPLEDNSSRPLDDPGDD
ncbi:MAG TPA: PH domain-containing protein [Streptosporangiaceae bacterium]|nr:PH domain-containing protein [Streptosporangiaceae bacterium]